MVPFRIHLFGSLRVFREADAVSGINTNRLQSLLAYLVLHDAPQSREHLAFLLWPESSESQARTNLRQLLHYLRRALTAECEHLWSDNHSVEWRRGTSFSCDFFDFQAAVAQADDAFRRGDQAARLVALEHAASLCQDELLGELYDDWLRPVRERQARQLSEVLSVLASIYEARSDLPGAIRCASRLVAQDPLCEPNHQLLIRLHAANHDRASALRAYHQCMRTLRRELAVEPDASTRELFEKLLKSESAPAERPELPSPAAAPAPAMVGRKREWQRLVECWRVAAGGGVRLAVISGEPGIGKSRLAEELYDWCAKSGAAVARARCYEAQGQLAYAPVAEWLRASPLSETRGVLSQRQLGELARVLPELLSSNPDLDRPRPLAESWEKHHFFESLNAAFTAARKPLLLFVDDLQWCDPDSFEWLHSLFRSDAAQRILILATARPEGTSRGHPLSRLLGDLQQSGRALEIPLAPLDSQETAALAAQVAGAPLDATHLDDLYRDTKGNPLFVVESLRAESAGIAAPPRIHAVIAARFAQLSTTAYELAGLAGAIGQAFSIDLLAKASDWDEDSLFRALDELWQRRIIEGKGESLYDFTHDRLREVAYSELTPVRRRFLHRRIARAIEELSGPGTLGVSALLAAHYDAAGMAESAIERYRAAAGVARQRYADAEAASLLRRALDLCLEFPESGRRDRQELDLRVELCTALVTTLGYAIPEVGESYTRALALAQTLGDRKQAFHVMNGLWVFHVVRGELETSRNLAEKVIETAHGRDEEEVFALIGRFAAGSSLFHLGRLAESETSLRAALASYKGGSHPSVEMFAGPDTGMFCHSYLSHVLWYLGYIDQSATHNSEALRAARETGHPFSVVTSLDYSAMLHVFRQESRQAQTLAGEAIAICRRHGFPYYGSMAEILAGWATALEEKSEAGISQLRHGLDALKSTGGELRLPFYYGLLAEVCSVAGRSADAMAHIANAFAYQSKNGEQWILAELHRIHGDLLQRAGDGASARIAYGKAVEDARRIGALPLELRALLRLGDVKAVGSLYSRFTEGFESPGLTAARALLHSAER